MKKYPALISFWRNGRIYKEGSAFSCGDDATVTKLQRQGLIGAEMNNPAREVDSIDVASTTGAGTVDAGMDATKDGTSAANTGAESSGTETATTVEQSQPTQAELFAQAVAKLEPNNEGHWMKSGAPEVKALAEAGFVCTAAERNALWQAHKDQTAGA